MISMENFKQESDLAATNDNSNPQQGNGTRSTQQQTSCISNDREFSAKNTNEAKHSVSRVDPNKKEERKLFVGGLPRSGEYSTSQNLSYLFLQASKIRIAIELWHSFFLCIYLY